MLWWHWLVIGLALIALEMATPGGFFVIFFGVGALLIAGLHMVGITGPLWLHVALFSVFSVGSLLLFRNPLLRMLDISGGSVDLDNLLGEIGTAIDDIEPGAIGRLELRGAMWTARNTGTVAIARGHRSIVVERDRLTLFIRSEEAA